MITGISISEKEPHFTLVRITTLGGRSLRQIFAPMPVFFPEDFYLKIVPCVERFLLQTTKV